MTAPRHVVIVGATSALAQQCARLWLRQPVASLVLVGRQRARLEVVAADLRVRNPQTAITLVEGDFASPADIARMVREAAAAAPPDTVLIAHGSLPDQAACQADLQAAAEALSVNGVSPALFAEAFVPLLERARTGTLGIIGSVAGDRGRKSNYVYGAAKGLVARYAQGLQHRLAASGVRVVLIEPGPTDTPMTAHLKQDGARLADAGDVAAAIVRGMAAGRPVVYAPAKWWLIMMVIRHLPRFVFHRMNI